MNIRGSLASLFSLNALVWLAMLTGLAAIVCFAGAAWFAMLPKLGAPLASLLTGLGLLLVMALLLVVVHKTTQPSQPSTTEQPPANSREAYLEDNLGPLIGERATQWTREHTGAVMVGALAAGVLLAASPGARRLLSQAAGPLVTRKAMETYKDFSGPSGPHD